MPEEASFFGLTQAKVDAAREAERDQRGQEFAHYHHQREFYGNMVLMRDRSFPTYEEANKADLYLGHCVIIGCNRPDCGEDE